MGLLLPLDPGPEHCPAIAESAGIQHPLLFLPLGRKRTGQPYTLASLIAAYHFHVRKNKGLSLSGIVSAITGVNPQGFWGRLVDLMFLIATVGALTISLVVTAATFTPRPVSADRTAG